MAERALRVCALYPDHMNIYADRGNLLLLERRCAWRGIGFIVTAAAIGDDVDPDAHDLFYLGGYVVFALALGRLVRDRTRRSTLDMGPFLDTATVTAGPLPTRAPVSTMRLPVAGSICSTRWFAVPAAMSVTRM